MTEKARATAPHRLPWSDWWLILRRVGGQVGLNKLPLLSAGIAFFAILSIAPVLVTALSVYGAVNTPEQASEQLTGLARMLPEQVEPVVADQLTSIAAASTHVETVRGITALAIALWTATTAMVSLMDALTVVYHESETRGLLRRTAVALAFVLLGALLLGAVIAGAGAGADALAGASGVVHAAVPVMTWILLAALMSAVLAVLYRLGPDRKSARWQWTSWGATGATVVWLAASVVLFAYVQRLGTYEATYGSLAGVAISMFWLWLTVLLVLIGAAVNAEAERQTFHDTTVGPDRPVGERGAVVADSVPPYPEDR
ncbi:YihY/virulence factor BrkB family protein [Nocardioides mesophilus]|uniref:YihY/virulence factor BrkB family protein n=1 Tax=Nocardioides mesophilus TaxID=433659 RepID=A0A7G9R9S1_9ACTN|nr:YihY/virulence factor BrkB family protein [Nocardioides mesophilus]QNN52346.1 YihY/virulence factor BrkB family protein [Nocardioides mesophilus]